MTRRLSLHMFSTGNFFLHIFYSWLFKFVSLEPIDIGRANCKLVGIVLFIYFLMLAETKKGICGPPLAGLNNWTKGMGVLTSDKCYFLFSRVSLCCSAGKNAI